MAPGWPRCSVTCMLYFDDLEISRRHCRNVSSTSSLERLKPTDGASVTRSGPGWPVNVCPVTGEASSALAYTCLASLLVHCRFCTYCLHFKYRASGQLMQRMSKRGEFGRLHSHMHSPTHRKNDQNVPCNHLRTFLDCPARASLGCADPQAVPVPLP